MRIAVWSGPRNLSTALMYSFAARGDCAALDEPFYAAFLAATGADHPMREAILVSQESDPARVGAQCEGEVPQGKCLFYQKHMTHHMLPEFPRGWMRACVNVFLIRHPAQVIASYLRKREDPTLTDLGFVQQSELFDEVAASLGTAPPVVDSADIRRDPRSSLDRLCAALGIPFTDRMLSWPAGPRPFDGVWASHWYGAVHRSTGFEPPEEDLPVLPAASQRLCDLALPHYERLAAHAIAGPVTSASSS